MMCSLNITQLMNSVSMYMYMLSVQCSKSFYFQKLNVCNIETKIYPFSLFFYTVVTAYYILRPPASCYFILQILLCKIMKYHFEHTTTVAMKFLWFVIMGVEIGPRIYPFTLRCKVNVRHSPTGGQTLLHDTYGCMTIQLLSTTSAYILHNSQLIYLFVREHSYNSVCKLFADTQNSISHLFILKVVLQSVSCLHNRYAT